MPNGRPAGAKDGPTRGPVPLPGPNATGLPDPLDS